MIDKFETYSAKTEVSNLRKRRTRWERIWLDLKKAPPTAIFGIIIIIFYAFTAIFAPVLAPYGEADSQFQSYMRWGEDGHVFGTDQIGRDILSRLIYGARNTIGIALITTILSFLIGGGLGLIAAINRSILDQLLSRGVDVLMAIPGLIFELML